MIYVPCDTTFLREVYILSDEFFFSGLVWWSVPLEQFTISWTLVILTNFNPWAARLPPSVKINVYDRKSLCQAPPKIDQSPKTCIEKHVLIGLKGINTVPKRLNSLNFILNFFFEKIIIFSIFKVYLALHRESSRPEKCRSWGPKFSDLNRSSDRLYPTFIRTCILLFSISVILIGFWPLNEIKIGHLGS